MQAWDEGAAAFARATRLRSPAQFATTAAELSRFTTLPPGCTAPVEILVGDARNRPQSKQWQAHWRKTPLPPGSVWDLGDDRYVTGPEYFYLRQAPKLTFVQAVLLGLEICGFYSTVMRAPYRQHCDDVRQAQGGILLANPWPPASWDMQIDHQDSLMRQGFVVRRPLTTSTSLSAYLRRALSSNSNSRALIAAGYVMDNSHSPMESRLYMRYCLPRRYGGLNLMPVELNRGFELSPDIVAATGITNYSVDLYWPTGGIAIEYQGRYSHQGLTAEQKDRLKRNILETAGVRIISIDSRQFENDDILDLYAREIAAAIGVPAWRLKASPSESSKRLALMDELRAWDVDLYR